MSMCMCACVYCTCAMGTQINPRTHMADLVTYRCVEEKKKFERYHLVSARPKTKRNRVAAVATNAPPHLNANILDTTFIKLSSIFMTAKRKSTVILNIYMLEERLNLWFVLHQIKYKHFFSGMNGWMNGRLFEKWWWLNGRANNYSNECRFRCSVFVFVDGKLFTFFFILWRSKQKGRNVVCVW